ncbi:MAG TPA: ferritin-like domain-containing protein [Polyangia bacterium]
MEPKSRSLDSTAGRRGDVPLARYIEASRKLDLTGIDWDRIADHPIDPRALDCLVYMADIEGFTVAYLRDMLNTAAIDDPEIPRFLTLWAYEELFHQEALARFLAAYGITLQPTRQRDLRQRRTLRDRAMMSFAGMASRLAPDFIAAYLTWGAINELSTLTAYELLAARTGHPILSDLLGRIVKDERRHFSFYYNRARRRLEEPRARRMTSALIKHFWQPVGDGVKTREEMEATIHHCLAGPAGLAAARRMDGLIAALPGLEWFRRWEEFWQAGPTSGHDARVITGGTAGPVAAVGPV